VGDLLLKKLKSEYQYLKTEKEYQEQIFNKAQSEFKDYFNPKLGIQEPKPQKKQPKKKPKMRSSRLAKLYKKLAHKIHPDKKTGNQGDFAELKKSVDENNVEKIIDLATDYGIDINEDIDSVDFYENRIDDLKAKIDHFSKTVVMQWWNMSEDDRKKYETTFLHVLRTS
tara:strand:+ start:855 stop:1361 length:507 start_codon:yes stop_codon:yes gene_type:complete